MPIKYITIEREYGSGGTQIAEEVAKKCGINYYGREIMEGVAKEQNVSIDDLEYYEGHVSSSLLYSMFVVNQSQTGDPDLLSNEAKLFVAETRMIKKLALKGPALFVGHCACEALKDQKGVLRVFIRSNDKAKEKRIINDYGISPKDVHSVCKKNNKRRANYYAFCTNKKWHDLDNYDLVLNSSKLGIKGCVYILSSIIKKSNNQ